MGPELEFILVLSAWTVSLTVLPFGNAFPRLSTKWPSLGMVRIKDGIGNQVGGPLDEREGIGAGLCPGPQ